MKLLIATIFLCVGVGAQSTAWAHGGGLNAEGCHNERATGGYHCHGAKSAARPQESTYSPNQLSSLYQQRSQGQSGAFANCAAARAAGAAPVRRGDPGYGSHLDRDNDGVGCE